ncbi:MAG TPA: hypothetical protein VFE13_07370, partial [Caulobacteraceae bacterium]|nr:hypothetical protein [Caulobacteraceae bacterium]
TMNSNLAGVTQRLKSTGRIEADDVLALRRALYGAPKIASEDIEALVDLDGAAPARGLEWTDFFAAAVIDYVVRQQEPADYVDAVKAAWAMGVFRGELTADGSLEALVRIVEAATSVPAELATFILGKVKDVVARAGAVDAAAVVLLKRLVFAGGGPGNVGVTREEADVLFDVNDACRRGRNDATWADFFAKAVADSLTAVSPFRLESREDAARDAAWLAERESPLDFMGQMARAPDVRGAMHDILSPFADAGDEWTKAEADMEVAEAEASAITEEEARWLIGRLGEGVLGEPEQKLLQLLKSLSPPSIERLSDVLDKAA